MWIEIRGWGESLLSNSPFSSSVVFFAPPGVGLLHALADGFLPRGLLGIALHVLGYEF